MLYTKSTKFIHLKNFYVYGNTRILPTREYGFVDSPNSSTMVIINSLAFSLRVGGY